MIGEGCKVNGRSVKDAREIVKYEKPRVDGDMKRIKGQGGEG